MLTVKQFADILNGKEECLIYSEVYDLTTENNHLKKRIAELENIIKENNR